MRLGWVRVGTVVAVCAACGPGSDPAPPSIEVRLDDAPLYIEGFNYAVRVDGEQRDLAAFTHTRSQRGGSYRTTIPIAPGPHTILSDLVDDAFHAPTFTSPCRTEVTVAPAGPTVVTLDWKTGCLRPAGAPPAPSSTVPTPAAPSPPTPAPTTTAAALTPTTPGIEVRLDDAPDFYEGFDYGVRVGGVERVLSTFTESGGPDGPFSYRTSIPVPVGKHTVLSDLEHGGPGPAPKPTFLKPCASDVTITANGATILRLDWATGCLGPI